MYSERQKRVAVSALIRKQQRTEQQSGFILGFLERRPGDGGISKSEISGVFELRDWWDFQLKNWWVFKTRKRAQTFCPTLSMNIWMSCMCHSGFHFIWEIASNTLLFSCHIAFQKWLCSCQYSCETSLNSLYWCQHMWSQCTAVSIAFCRLQCCGIMLLCPVEICHLYCFRKTLTGQ